MPYAATIPCQDRTITIIIWRPVSDHIIGASGSGSKDEQHERPKDQPPVLLFAITFVELDESWGGRPDEKNREGRASPSSLPMALNHKGSIKEIGFIVILIVDL